ncbi:class II histocompatibility antigen, B-L beta chain-like [Eucyclogobius newberryi]|uniref:class II histocompatibility antigen, B-L beta chain-like n=1 Tax=Eucyclogobius newberryi TaxID=166745 RepID=UPI003B59F569
MKSVGSLLLMCFDLLISKTDAHYASLVTRCQSNADDPDVLYIIQGYYNKQLFVSYNSTEGKVIGYTEKMKEYAALFNKSPSIQKELKNGKKNCKKDATDIHKSAEGAAQEPQVRVFSTKTGSSLQPGILVCSAYSFYPKPITLTWLRNEEEVMSGVTSTEEMSDGNWLYQKHSYLEYTPTAADNISCMVEHASLSSPKLYPSENFPESRRNKLAVGTAGLVLGLAFLIAGVIYYRKHTRGPVLKPTY